MRPLAILIALLLLAAPAYAKPPRVNGVLWIGALQLRFDANRWDVNGADSSFDIFCKTSECSHTAIAVSIIDKDNACTPELLKFNGTPPALSGRIDRFDNGGLDFLVAEGDFDCKALAGGPVRACTSFAGKTYLINAPGDGCRTRTDASHYIDEILRGLSPR